MFLDMADLPILPQEHPLGGLDSTHQKIMMTYLHTADITSILTSSHPHGAIFVEEAEQCMEKETRKSSWHPVNLQQEPSQGSM